jgi:hypothetical protein
MLLVVQKLLGKDHLQPQPWIFLTNNINIITVQTSTVIHLIHKRNKLFPNYIKKNQAELKPDNLS